MNARIASFWFRAAAHATALGVLAWLAWDYFRDNLGADPVRELQLRTGDWAINFLMLSLVWTPLARLTGYTPVMPLRRTFGIYAFILAAVHLLNFLWLDYGFNFTFLREDLFEKRYAVAGLVSFLLMLPLAVATFRAVRQRQAVWRPRLSWLVLAAAVAAVVHYVWLTKAGYTRPILYGGILAVLLLVRLPWLSRRLARR